MFDRIRYKALAKERLTHHWSYLAGLTLIVLLLSSVSMLFSWIPLIGIIISIFIAAPLSMSLNMIVKKLFLKEDIDCSWNYQKLQLSSCILLSDGRSKLISKRGNSKKYALDSRS